jgi:hypothetical protein
MSVALSLADDRMICIRKKKLSAAIVEGERRKMEKMKIEM